MEIGKLANLEVLVLLHNDKLQGAEIMLRARLQPRRPNDDLFVAQEWCQPSLASLPNSSNQVLREPR